MNWWETMVRRRGHSEVDRQKWTIEKRVFW